MAAPHLEFARSAKPCRSAAAAMVAGASRLPVADAGPHQSSAALSWRLLEDDLALPCRGLLRAPRRSPRVRRPAGPERHACSRDLRASAHAPRSQEQPRWSQVSCGEREARSDGASSGGDGQQLLRARWRLHAHSCPSSHTASTSRSHRIARTSRTITLRGSCHSRRCSRATWLR